MANFIQNIFTKNSKLTVDQLIVKKTIVSFFFFFVFGIAAFCAWKWLRHQPATADGARKPLRKVLNANETVFKGLVSNNRFTKEYPKSAAAKKARVNGDLGLKTPFDPAAWKMYVIRKNGDTLKITLD